MHNGGRGVYHDDAEYMPKRQFADFGGSKMAAALVEACVMWLSVYVYRIVPLLTLLMHLILAVFSDSRRREGRGWKRVLVWVAYQLTDWGPAYVIGNLYLETSPSEKMMVAFWVPFLLLHHGRPDNIGAYAIEDAKLWLRLLVLDIPLSVGSFFVVYRYILAECTAGLYLRWASGIMLPLGILKHLENTLALRRSELGHIRDRGFSNKQMFNLDDYRDQEKLSELEDEKALLVAHELFEICKGAFCDYPSNINHDDIMNMFSEDRWESMCKVVEMELSLMYDILYTKAAVVHTWHGYAIRLASPPSRSCCLVSTAKRACRQKMKLSVMYCCGGWKKLRRFVKSLCISQLSLWLWTCACPKEPKSYRRWPGIFGQCNLLSQCTAGNRHNLYSMPRLAIEWEGHSSLRDFQWEDHSRGLEIPDSVKKLVFQNIWEKLFRDPVELAKRERQSNTDDSPPRPPNHDKRCPSCGKLLGYCTCPGSPNHDEHCPSCGELPDYCTCHPTSPNPDKGCFDVSCGPVRPPGCGNLPNYCTCVSDPGGTPYPRERVCNGIDDEPALCPQYPREWICNGVEDQAAPWLQYQYPRERICSSVNNEPPRLPYPWQVCAGIRNAPFEENEYNVQARPHHHPDEQAAEYSLELYEQETDRWSSSYAWVPPDTKPKGQSDEDMGFPPELQEAILIRHITTNVFLSCSCSSSPRITGEESKEQAKAIEQMSDYMMFLIANHPKMLPDLETQECSHL
uniref:DUF4220 domain-containing protein n=1 Tax=Aegilops tauschii TaxID=37682 RepID=R7W3B0_AEGTA